MSFEHYCEEHALDADRLLDAVRVEGEEATAASDSAQDPAAPAGTDKSADEEMASTPK
jgi:hypothetical protein